MLMMRPARRLIIGFKTACTHVNTAVKFVVMYHLGAVDERRRFVDGQRISQFLDRLALLTQL